MALRGYLVSEIAQDCADGLLSRREALRRLALMGVGAAAGVTLLAGCGDDDDAAPASTAAADGTTTPTSSSTSAGETIRFEGESGELIAAFAAPDAPTGAVLVCHENRGLTPHFYDVVGRLAADGYAALCVDLASPAGGTETLGDEGAVASLLGEASIGQLVADLKAGIGELSARAPDVELGAVGFCFGGAMVWELLAAGESPLAAAVPFYGPAPSPADFSGARAAVLAIYGELDSRVNASMAAAEAALQEAGLTYEIKTFPGADHAFFNDTGTRYNEAAATEAYADLLGWFEDHLA